MNEASMDDLDEADQWLNSSSLTATPKRIPPLDLQPYPSFGLSNYSIDVDPSFAAPPKPEIPDDPTRPSEFWNPTAVLTNLSFLEEKIHQLQSLVRLIAESNSGDLKARQRQHQLVTADVASVIGQLISAAGSLLPSINTPPPAPPVPAKFPDPDRKDEHADEADEGDTLPPGAYEILQLEKEEILAPHTHFCPICGKGFKRDANLRMHMRGHGDEYKTAAALAKPPREPGPSAAVATRYSCPFTGCKRNKSHRKFQPLKTILCVKNHYKRTHCDKSFTCSRCKTKKFSVIADLKTHEKHCGKDRWLCSCGTTFSRKDKLFGHISLFQGHTPAIPTEELTGGSQTASKAKDGVDDPASYFSALDFDACDFGGFNEFPRSQYEDPESSLYFLSCNNYPQKSDDLQ